MPSKRVNILVLLPENEIFGPHIKNDVARKSFFQDLKNSLMQLIGANKYTIYAVTHNEINLKPWQSTTKLLINFDDGGKLKNEIDNFVSLGGININLSLNEVALAAPSENKAENVIKLNEDAFKLRLMSSSVDIFNENKISERQAGALTEGYLAVKNSKTDNLLSKLKLTRPGIIVDGEEYPTLMRNTSRLYFINNQINKDNLIITNDCEDNSAILTLPVFINSDYHATAFDFETYFSHLNTKTIGEAVMYAETVTTTMHLIDALSDIDGIVVTAHQQIAGRGRRGNEWLSPKGCAMFSLYKKLSLNSNIGRSLGFLQHLMALAVVKSILDIPGYSDLRIGLKWPNDIYWLENKVKLGGLIVSTTLNGKNVGCYFGVGINVFNSQPTACINDVIMNYNLENSEAKLKFMTCEEVIARALTQFEVLLEAFENCGVQYVKQLYLKHWMHSGQKVKMKSDNSEDLQEGIIEGVDDQGYLLVRNSDGCVLSVHPDGNRFDLLHNLCTFK